MRIASELWVNGENAPSDRIVVDRAKIGAALSKRLIDGLDELRLNLDSPSFAHPNYANLFDDQDGERHSLILLRSAFRLGEVNPSPRSPIQKLGPLDN